MKKMKMNDLSVYSRLGLPLIWLGVGLTLAACATGPGPRTAADGTPGPGGARVLTADAVKFEQIAPFVRMGSAWGNRAHGAHGSFGIFPGAAMSPPHTHSHGYHGVVISGEMTNPFGAESHPARMGAGSHWYVPAGAQHVTACVSKEPCLFYFHADAGFDFTPLSQMGGVPPRGALAQPASAITYAEVAPFVQMGSAWGDRSKGAHGTFGIFKAGAASPVHTHSGAYHGVVISGVMTNPFDGETNPPRMGSGSYWHVPAGARHVTACVSKEPCVFYFHADSGFDFHELR